MEGVLFNEVHSSFVECAVHFAQLAIPARNFDINNVGGCEKSHFAEFDFERVEIRNCLAEFRFRALNGTAKIPGRKKRHMRMRTAFRCQFQPKMIEKTTQRIRGNVADEGKLVALPLPVIVATHLD